MAPAHLEKTNIMATSLVKNALKFLPAKAPKGQKALLEELTENMTKDDQNHFDPKLLADVTTTHWKLAQKRVDGEPKLKIYCPPRQRRCRPQNNHRCRQRRPRLPRRFHRRRSQQKQLPHRPIIAPDNLRKI